METHKISEIIVSVGVAFYFFFLFATLIAAVRIPEGSELKKLADFVAALYGSGFIVAAVCLYGNILLKTATMIYTAFLGARQ